MLERVARFDLAPLCLCCCEIRRAIGSGQSKWNEDDGENEEDDDIMHV